MIAFGIVLSTSYLAFLYYNIYQQTHESSFVTLAGLVGIIAVLQIVILILISSLEQNYDNDDNNGGKKKIYPDNSDYSEKVLELYK